MRAPFFETQCSIV